MTRLIQSAVATTVAVAIVTIATTIVGVEGLDVKLQGTECDSSLPVTLDMYMTCNNGARCTFGEQVKIYGSMHYNNVANSGIQNNIAYMTASLELWTLNFHLFDMLPISLCDDTMEADSDNQYACPGNGSYDYSVNYTLPGAGSEQTSWLASGWNGDGIIQLFAEADESMKIGECKLDLHTYVTRAESNKTMLEFPSAAVASGLFLGALAFFAMIMCYCYCCRRSRRVSEKPTEEVSYFKQLEDTTSTTKDTTKSGKGISRFGRKNKKADKAEKTEESTHTTPSVVSDLM